jgi:hypothetical protein
MAASANMAHFVLIFMAVSFFSVLPSIH